MDAFDLTRPTSRAPVSRPARSRSAATIRSRLRRHRRRRHTRCSVADLNALPTYRGRTDPQRRWWRDMAGRGDRARLARPAGKTSLPSRSTRATGRTSSRLRPTAVSTRWQGGMPRWATAGRSCERCRRVICRNDPVLTPQSGRGVVSSADGVSWAALEWISNERREAVWRFALQPANRPALCIRGEREGRGAWGNPVRKRRMGPGQQSS
jgi:hypothetical protein